MTDRLEDAFTQLAAHIEQHGTDGPESGLVELGQRLGMTFEDLSDGFDIHRSLVLSVNDAAKLSLIYLMVFVDEHQPLHEDYWLELTGRGPRSHARHWRFTDGVPALVGQKAA